MSNPANTNPLVDLVIVIDTSPSMKDEAQALSDSTQKAITSASQSCPSNLRVVWLGIEGIWKGTNFNQTVRNYLTQRCKVPATKLRLRTKGQLKSAGAQEDATRTIEDISDYFDWRSGAAKAIFYLGDEALEGGGDKTTQKDIEAANIAIQKAKASEVTVHTYFGTSRSRYRQTIISEYARVADETGGRAFTHQDTISGFSAVLEQVICSSRTANATKLRLEPLVAEQSTIYEPIIPKQQEQTSQNKTIKENDMTLLTIDTKNNCYVINTDGMNHLQQNVANSLTLSQGTYEIKISEGRYSFNKNKSEGEPFVLLWIYGIDGSTFINQNTSCEVGATWTTLNGYNDILRLEVKNQVVVCALFFDIDSSDNSGTIKLSITSNNSSFQPQELTVDSKNNCYVLDEKYLTSLRQWNANFVELKTGNYQIKIRESNANYWSSEQKFNLEPWALIWIKDSKFIPKLTGIETSETWCSLNGLQDELILEVKGTITLSGFFFDTYKEDNEGQIILEIQPVSSEELIQLYKQKETIKASETRTVVTGGQTIVNVGVSESATRTVVTGGEKIVSPTRSNVVTGGQTIVGVGVSGGSTSFSGGGNFSFRFDETQIEEMWKQMAAKIETSVTVTDEQDEKQEAFYWDNLEKWILKGYQQQAKELAMQVARVEFMMKAFSQQMEGNFNQIFQGWSSYFDSRLNELVSNQIVTVIEEQVNRKISQQTQDIKKLVVEQMQVDMDKRIEAALNLKITKQTQDIKKLVVEQMQADMDKRIETTVNVKVSDRTPEFNSVIIKQIQAEMDKRIDAVVTLKIGDQTDHVKNLVIKQIQADIDKRIDNSVNVKIDAQTENIKNLVIEQIQLDMDKRLEAVVNLKLTDQTESIKNLVITQVEANIDKRIQMFIDQSGNRNVDVVVNNILGDIDDRINVNFDHKILNFREDVSYLVKNEINENYTKSLTSIVLADLKNQQFYLDMQSIKGEVQNFYARLGQFENQLNLRITQGDTRLYNWTLEQLIALQGCLTDRQALLELFESFSAKAKTVLDNAGCVQPNRFTAWVTTETNPQIEPVQPAQLPGGEQSK